MPGLSAGWQTAFRDNEASRVVAYMQRIWRELANAGQKGIEPSHKEPRITQFFGAVLDERKAEDGLESDFLYEVLRGKADLVQGKLVKVYRTDIEYRTLGSDRSLLVFEFKKLTTKKKSRDAYLLERGMLRFISGNYQRREAVAFMAGLVHVDADQSIEALKKAIEQPETIAALTIKKNSVALAIREPSENFPGQAAFDTAHCREQAGQASLLYLSHLFFDHNPASGQV